LSILLFALLFHTFYTCFQLLLVLSWFLCLDLNLGFFFIIQLHSLHACISFNVNFCSHTFPFLHKNNKKEFFFYTKENMWSWCIWWFLRKNIFNARMMQQEFWNKEYTKYFCVLVLRVYVTSLETYWFLFYWCKDKQQMKFCSSYQFHFAILILYDFFVIYIYSTYKNYYANFS